MKRKHLVRVSLIVVAGTIAFNATGCGVGIVPGNDVENIETGYTGLKIQLYGDAKQSQGIDNAEIVTGKVFYNGYTETVKKFPTFVNIYPFTDAPDQGGPGDESIPFSVGGSQVRANVNLAFGFSTDPVDPKKPQFTKLHHFYKTYLKTPDQFRDTALRTGLSTCFSSSANSSIYPNPNPLDPKLKGADAKIPLTVSTLPNNLTLLALTVKDCLQSAYPDIVVERVDILGQPKLPDAVQKSIDEKFASQQAAQTAESNRKKVVAEAGAKVAKAKGDADAAIETARGEAESNRLKAASITPQLLELRKLEMQQEVELAKANKWDGKQATIVQSANNQVGGAGK